MILGLLKRSLAIQFDLLICLQFLTGIVPHVLLHFFFIYGPVEVANLFQLLFAVLKGRVKFVLFVIQYFFMERFQLFDFGQVFVCIGNEFLSLLGPSCDLLLNL